MYVVFQVNRWKGDVRTGEIPSRSCALCDCRSDRISFTREKLWEIRASRDAIEPLDSTMLVGSTNTGRASSSASANRTSGLKLRSTWLCWFRLSEYVTSAFA